MEQYGLGLVFVLLASILWDATAIIVPILSPFLGPFLITYAGACLFVFIIPLSLRNARLAQQYNSAIPVYRNRGDAETAFPCSLSPNSSVGSEMSYLLHYNATQTRQKIYFSSDLKLNAPVIVEQKSIYQILRCHMAAAVKIAPFWFLSNYLYNYSLQHTSITSSTILSNTSCAFALFFALLSGEGQLFNGKTVGVIIALCGSILTLLHDANLFGSNSLVDADNNINSRLWGDLAGLLSALCDVFYGIILKKVSSNDGTTVSLLLGCVGLLHMVLMGPLAFHTFTQGKMNMHHQSKLDSLLPFQYERDNSGPFVLVLLLLKGVFGTLIPDYFWGNAIVFTSSTVATVGLIVTIPLAFLSDALIMHIQVWTVNSLLGALMVTFGFVFINID